MSAFTHGLAGAFSSFFAFALLYPLDQFRVSSHLTGSGVLGYRGMTSTLQTMTASHFVYFFTYTAARGRGPLLAAALAGTVNVLLTNPLWVSTMRGRDPARCEQWVCPFFHVLQIARSEGVRGLYSGLGPSLWLITNPALQFLFYEKLKHFVLGLKNGEFDKRDAFLAGGLSKLGSTLCTYPLQVAQTRLRVREGGGAELSTVSCLRELKALGGLYRGLGAKLLQSALNSAIMFTTYEHVLRAGAVLKG